MRETAEHAYDTAMERVERGMVAVCVPGHDDDGPFVLTSYHPVDDDSRRFVYDDDFTVRAEYAAGAMTDAHRRVAEIIES